MNTVLSDRFLPADDFEQRAENLILPAGVWNVAAEISESGGVTPYELEYVTGQGSNQVWDALKQLLSEKLVRQETTTWKEFSEARKIALAEAANSPGANDRQAGSIGDSRYGRAPNQTRDGVALRLGSIAPPQSGARATNAWVWQKPDPARVAASKPVIPAELPGGEYPNGRLLRPLLEQIANLKGGGVEGQLMVYQVFLQVPYQLLHDEGIRSLHFVDDSTVIQNPVLHSAIVKAARDVTGVELS